MAYITPEKCKTLPYLVPESGIQQVQHSVLLTSHVQIYWEPTLALLSEYLFRVLRVSEAKVIPAAASPL